MGDPLGAGHSKNVPAVRGCRRGTALTTPWTPSRQWAPRRGATQGRRCTLLDVRPDEGAPSGRRVRSVPATPAGCSRRAPDRPVRVVRCACSLVSTPPSSLLRAQASRTPPARFPGPAWLCAAWQNLAWSPVGETVVQATCWAAENRTTFLAPGCRRAWWTSRTPRASPQASPRRAQSAAIRACSAGALTGPPPPRAAPPAPSVPKPSMVLPVWWMFRPGAPMFAPCWPVDRSFVGVTTARARAASLSRPLWMSSRSQRRWAGFKMW
jgi:hypothetical protein